MEKKKIVISSITVAVLLVLVVASSYAYFAARIQSSGQTSINVGAKTLDSVSFNTGSDISLIANQDNFALGKGDLTGSTTASVTFTARNDEASSYTYWLSFSSSNNTFEYTTNKLQDKNGNIIYNLYSGLLSVISLTDNTPDITCYMDVDAEVTSVITAAVFSSDINFKDVLFSSKVNAEKLDNSIGIFNYKVHITYDESERQNDGDIKYMVFLAADGGDIDLATAAAKILCIDNKSEDAKTFETFDISTYEEIGIPELELTIKKNGETWIDSLDITGMSEFIVLPFQTKEIANKFYKENYGSFRNWSNAVKIGEYVIYSCMKNYYPTFNSYFEENLEEKNGGYDAFKTSICNGNASCESQVDERYNSCTSLTDEYFWPTISAEAGKTTTDTWEAIVTFKNLDTDQIINLDKDFAGEFDIDNFDF